MNLINEPVGRAEFADKVQKPTYDQTMEFINTKPAQHSWSLRWGARSSKFLMIHPEGAYFLNPATLNPLVKTKEEGRQFSFQIEMDRPDVTMSAIDLKGGEVSGVKMIRIPCNDKIDSEKLSKAFRHLILAAGGKEDPF